MSETNEEVKVTRDEKTGDTIMKKPTRYARTEPTAQELAAEEALKAREESSTEENTQEVEPEGAEEQSFKKRYGDLRRHMQKTTEDKDKEIKKLQEQLSLATKKEIKLPKTDEEIESWAKEYPDVAKIVETIAMKKAAEQSKDIEDRLNALSEKERLTSRERAEMELLQIHPDFADIRDSDDFHEWAEEQPKWVQDALYENSEDARSAARAIDLYKSDRNISKPTKEKSSKSAASEVKAKSTRSVPDSEGVSNKILESAVQKMSATEYEKRADEIMEAIRSGNFVYDLSSSAR